MKKIDARILIRVRSWLAHEAEPTRENRKTEIGELPTQAQRPGARDATMATATLPPGSLPRMVRPHGLSSSVLDTNDNNNTVLPFQGGNRLRLSSSFFIL
jgi:hypothetical protein